MATKNCGNCKCCLSSKCHLCDPCIRDYLKRKCVEKVCYSKREVKADINSLILGILECDELASELQIYPEQQRLSESSSSSESEGAPESDAESAGVSEEDQETPLFTLTEKDFEVWDEQAAREDEKKNPFILYGLYIGSDPDDRFIRESIAEMRKLFAKKDD